MRPSAPSITHRRWHGVVLALLSFPIGPVSLALPVIPNPSFELDIYRVWPGHAAANGGRIQGWEIQGAGVGINPVPLLPDDNRNAFPFADNGGIPNGYRVAFIQGVGTLRTRIEGLVPGAEYRVRFYANRRASTGVPRASWQLPGWRDEVTFDVSGAENASGAYRRISGTFVAVASSGELSVHNRPGEDATLLLDGFEIRPTLPFFWLEPADPGTGLFAWGEATQVARADALPPVNSFQSVAIGGAHLLGLTPSGRVLASGANDFGQCNVPAGLEGVIAIAAGERHSLALLKDGTLRGWGDNRLGQLGGPFLVGTRRPERILSIAAGANHCVVSTELGLVYAWGANEDGQSRVPENLAGVESVAAGASHSLALRRDGSVVGWGNNVAGKELGPGGVMALPGPATAIAAGQYHSMAIVRGEVVCWGLNAHGQCRVPDDLGAVWAIAGGAYHSVALSSGRNPVVMWGSEGVGSPSIPIPISRGERHLASVAAGGRLTIGLARPELDFGNVPPGGPPRHLDFLVRKLSLSDPGLLGEARGTDSSVREFQVARAPLTSPSEPDPDVVRFRVTYSPTASGIHQNGFNCGNNTYTVMARGTSFPPDLDTDGDGMSDLAEYQARALGMDRTLPQAEWVSLLRGVARSLGHYAPADLAVLNADALLLERDPEGGGFRIVLGIEKASGLPDFLRLPITAESLRPLDDGRLEFRFQSPEPAALFRFQAAPNAVDEE